MQTNGSLSNGLLGKHLSELRARSQRRKLLRQTVAFAFGLTLALLVLLTSGCATPLPLPSEPPIATSKPVPDKSPPSRSYSQQVQTFLEESQQKLTNGLTKP